MFGGARLGRTNAPRVYVYAYVLYTTQTKITNSSWKGFPLKIYCGHIATFYLFFFFFLFFVLHSTSFKPRNRKHSRRENRVRWTHHGIERRKTVIQSQPVPQLDSLPKDEKDPQVSNVCVRGACVRACVRWQDNTTTHQSHHIFWFGEIYIQVFTYSSCAAKQMDRLTSSE